MQIIYASGQTCNQFWIYSNYIADCIENHKTMAIWIPDMTLRYFPGLLTSEYITFPLYSENISKLIGYERYIKTIRSIFSNRLAIFLANFFLNLLPNTKFVQANVSDTRSIYRKKHINKIKLIFTPMQTITHEVNEVFKEKRQSNTLIIGIHMRYGDYANHRGGKYFYRLDEYKVIMHKIISLLPNKKIIFFIASNINISESAFDGINVITLNNVNAVKDLYGLSLCDFIAGPPSTFSAWASLYKNVPLYFIENIKDNFTIESFINIDKVWL
jgi:hypothetical protein